MMDFLALAGSRYPVRSFADTPVPEELLEKVLDEESNMEGQDA